MSTKILSITLLLFLVYSLCCQSSAANKRLGTRRFAPCCVKLSKANISDVVTGDTYRKQHASAPCVEAIILTTEQGAVCVDPKAEWVQEVIANMTKV